MSTTLKHSKINHNLPDFKFFLAILKNTKNHPFLTLCFVRVVLLFKNQNTEIGSTRDKLNEKWKKEGMETSVEEMRCSSCVKLN